MNNLFLITCVKLNTTEGQDRLHVKTTACSQSHPSVMASPLSEGGGLCVPPLFPSLTLKECNRECVKHAPRNSEANGGYNESGLACGRVFFEISRFATFCLS